MNYRNMAHIPDLILMLGLRHGEILLFLKKVDNPTVSVRTEKQILKSVRL